MAQKYKMNANFIDGFDNNKISKSGTSYAGCLPHMRQNYLVQLWLC